MDDDGGVFVLLLVVVLAAAVLFTSPQYTIETIIINDNGTITTYEHASNVEITSDNIRFNINGDESIEYTITGYQRYEIVDKDELELSDNDQLVVFRNETKVVNI